MNAVLVNCDSEEYERLRRLLDLWRDIPAAHQSNIVRDADAMCGEPIDQPRKVYRISLGSQNNESDRERIKQLCLAWPLLSRQAQVKLIEQAILVTTHTE